MRGILIAAVIAGLSIALTAPVAWAASTPPPDDTPLPRDAAPPPPPDNPDRGAPETPQQPSQRDDKVTEPSDASPHYPRPGDPAQIRARPDDKPKPDKPKLDQAARSR